MMFCERLHRIGLPAMTGTASVPPALPQQQRGPSQTGTESETEISSVLSLLHLERPAAPSPQACALALQPLSLS